MNAFNPGLSCSIRARDAFVNSTGDNFFLRTSSDASRMLKAVTSSVELPCDCAASRDVPVHARLAAVALTTVVMNDLRESACSSNMVGILFLPSQPDRIPRGDRRHHIDSRFAMSRRVE